MTGEFQTPASQGFHMPAEWESHEATWLNWPNFSSVSYPFGLEGVFGEFLDLIRIIAHSELAFVNVLDHAEERWILDRVGAEFRDFIRFFPIPTSEPWNRDIGPTFLVDRARKRRAAVSWRFDGWARRFVPCDLDAAAAAKMGNAIGCEVFEPQICLEGGGIDANGAGALMTTRSSIVDEVRNPRMSQVEAENQLKACTGVERVIWLPEGPPDDETDGHIDTLARWVSPKTVVCIRDADNAEFGPAILRRNFEILQAEGLDVLKLPPMRGFGCVDRVTPVSHANFYLTNGHVVVPRYGVGGDDAALELLGSLFADREAKSVWCRQIVVGLGGFHCVTQQVPALLALGDS